MRKRLAVTIFILLLAVVAGLVARFASLDEASAAPAVPAGFASPINGGCYIAAPNQCKLHVDPFTVNINEGGGVVLEKFTLYANGNPIYDFRTDVSNPPHADYAPSLVMADFAAECGQTYYMNLVAKDSSDNSPANYGQTAQFTCPAAVP